MPSEISKKIEGKDLWVSRFRIVTPAGKLSWSSLNEPNNTMYERKAAQAEQAKLLKETGEEHPLKLPPKKFRATLTWDNLDILQDQSRYKEFMAACKRFAKDAVPDVPDDEIEYPIRKVTPKDTSKDIYWALDATARGDMNRKPRMYHARRDEAITKQDGDNLYDGCLAAIDGTLRMSRMAYRARGGVLNVYYVRVQLGGVYHIDEGERYSGNPKLTSIDVSGFGINSDATTEQVREEDQVDF